MNTRKTLRGGAHSLIFALLIGVATCGPASIAYALTTGELAPTGTAILAKTGAESQPMEAGAQKFIASMGEQALGFLRNKSLANDGKQKEFRTLLETSFDMPTIARFSLGQYWRQMNPAQQKEYLSLFREYVVKVYSARFSEYSGQDFQTKGARPDNGTDTIVSSLIVPNQGEPVTVDWRVRYKNGHYQVVDVIVEGVSMSMTQRSDFSSVIQKGGGNVSALLAQLRQQAG